MKSTILFLLLIPIIGLSQSNNLSVLDRWRKYDDKDNALYNFYASEAYRLINEREVDIAKISTKAEWEARQENIKETLHKIIGDFPERTPLNAKTLGVSEKDDYRVEKVIFESRPNFFVTGALYIPKKLKGKAPAILYPVGHAQQAFRKKFYQRSAINFVKKGFVVFTYDPIGQGERVQYYSPELKKSKIGGSVREHIYVGLQTLLIGKSLANYFIWDGIRGVDYLLSRKEVDGKRIGITGLSGGGTQTTFIAAFDERIYAAAPSNFITSMRRLFESIGPQDAEQQLLYGLANKIDFADLLEVRIPKPTLVITTTRDFFSIQGARETVKEVKKIGKFYDDYNFDKVESDTTHAMTRINRETRHRFFQKSLNLPGDPTDIEVEYLDKELQITPTGQVSTLFNSKTVFDINKYEVEEKIAELKDSRKNKKKHKRFVKKASEELTGYIKPDKIESIVYRGRHNRGSYSIERWFIKGEGDYPIPFLLYLPNEIKGSIILYLNKDGKSKKDTTDNTIEEELRDDLDWFVKQGYPVLAADLIGFGELKQSKKGNVPYKGYGIVNYNIFFASVQLKRTLVGIQAADIHRLVKFIKQDKRINKSKIYAIAIGELLSTSLLHAAIFENEFKKLALVNPLISYKSVATNKYHYLMALSPLVPGALTAYDLPDLEAAFAPNKLMLVNIKNQMGKLASSELIDEDVKVVKDYYFNLDSEDNVQIKNIKKKQSTETLFVDWLKN